MADPRRKSRWLLKEGARDPLRWIVPVGALGLLVLVLAPDWTEIEPAQEVPEPAAQTPSHAPAGPVSGAATGSSEPARPETPAPTAPSLPGPDLPFALLGTDGDGAGEKRAGRTETDDTFDCIIEPSEIVDVGSALTAVVEEIHVDRSETVQAGQVVAVLETDVERAAVEVARARSQMRADIRAREASLSLGERKHERADKLYESRVVSHDLRDEAVTQAELARAELQHAEEIQRLMRLELDEARERLDRRIIRTPISGVVVERLKSPGEVVKEETILTVAKIDPLRVEVILPAAMFGSVSPGSRAEIRPEIPHAGLHVATVDVVDRVVDPRSGTFGVRLELANEDRSVPSGLHCQVKFLPGA